MRPAQIQHEARKAITEVRAIVDAKHSDLSVGAQSRLFATMVEARRPEGVYGPVWRQAVLNEQLSGY